MIIDCVARANPDLNLVTCSPMVLDDITNQPTDFVAATLILLSGSSRILDPVIVESKYAEEGRLFVTITNPPYLRGLRVHVSVVDDQANVAEVTVPVNVQEQTRFGAKVLPTAPQPEDDEAE